jgi:hypothetical protein
MSPLSSERWLEGRGCPHVADCTSEITFVEGIDESILLLPQIVQPCGKVKGKQEQLHCAIDETIAAGSDGGADIELMLFMPREVGIARFMAERSFSYSVELINGQSEQRSKGIVDPVRLTRVIGSRTVPYSS